jgi:Tol biopolymer transport system component
MCSRGPFVAVVGVAATLTALSSTAAVAHGAVPGANGKIAYVSTEQTNTTQIFLVSLGAVPEQLTYGSTSVGGAGARWDPAWSPDGTQLAYGHWLWGSATTADIYVASGDGESRRQLTSDPGWETDPAWSPDGSRIAFANTSGAAPSIWLIDAKGGSPALLHMGGYAPAWSPDGSKIAFVATAGSATVLSVMNADGSASHQVAPSVGPWQGSGPDLAPDWSPDGTKVVFLSRRSGNWEVWTIAADGGGLKQLTTGGRSGAIEYDPGFDPVWSPDGRSIAYGHDGTGAFALSVMNADGGGQTAVAPLTKVGSNWVGMPTWQPATDLSVRASLPSRARVGSRVTLVVTVRNASPLTARAVVATVSIGGARTTIVRAKATRGACRTRPRPSCSLGAVAAASSTRLSVVLEARARGKLTARATVGTSTPEATPATNAASAVTRIG